MFSRRVKVKTYPKKLPNRPHLLPWENRMARVQHTTNDNGQTSRLLDQIVPVGQFGEKFCRSNTKTKNVSGRKKGVGQTFTWSNES